MTLILSGTSGLSDVDGSAATPAIRGTDANTGIFFPAADTIAFSEGGVESMRIDASGNVGIGTSSPVLKLDVSGKVKFTGVEIAVSEDYTTNLYYSGGWKYRATGYGTTIGASSGAITFNNTASSGTADAAATLSERMRIDSSGNLLVGTTTAGGTGTYRGLTIGGNSNTSLGVTYDYAGALYRYNSIYENGWVWWNERAVGGPVQEFFVTSSFTKVGNINCTTTATNYVTSSDYRLKENVQPMQNALATVEQLKPCTYTWKVDGSDGQGFIAHELAEVCPQAVSGEKDAVTENGSIDPQGIDTSFLVATLTAAIQEQQAIITQLQADVAALKAR